MVLQLMRYMRKRTARCDSPAHVSGLGGLAIALLGPLPALLGPGLAYGQTNLDRLPAAGTDYVLRVIPEKPRTVVGGPVIIKLVLENHSTNEIGFYERRPLAHILTVKRHDGRAAELTAYGRWISDPLLGRGLSSMVLPVRPGQSLTKTILVSKAFDMTLDATYIVTARCVADGPHASDPPPSRVESGLASIEVEEWVDPPAKW